MCKLTHANAHTHCTPIDTQTHANTHPHLHNRIHLYIRVLIYEHIQAHMHERNIHSYAYGKYVGNVPKTVTGHKTPPRLFEKLERYYIKLASYSHTL